MAAASPQIKAHDHAPPLDDWIVPRLSGARLRFPPHLSAVFGGFQSLFDACVFISAIEITGDASRPEAIVLFHPNGSVRVAVQGATADTLVKSMETMKDFKSGEVLSIDGLPIAGRAPLSDIALTGFQLRVNGELIGATPAHVDKQRTSTAHEMVAVTQQLITLREQHAGMQKSLDVVRKRARSTLKLWAWGMVGVAYTQMAGILYGTYWLYSWDIMEPITFLLGFFDACCACTYFALKGRDYSQETFADMVVRKRTNKLLAKENVDLELVHTLEKKIEELQLRQKALQALTQAQSSTQVADSKPTSSQ